MNSEKLDDLFRSRGLQRDEIIEGVLERPCLALVIGMPGQGKSWLALEMAFSVATGRRFMGRWKTRPAPVLFVGEDAGRLDYVNQCSKLFQGNEREEDWKEEFSGLHFLIKKGVDLFETDLARVTQAVFEGQAGLVVLDTMRAMHGESENDSDLMRRAMANVQGIRDRAGSTVVLLHHTPWDKERVRGSADIEAASDVIFGVKGTKRILGPRDQDISMKVAPLRTKGLHTPEMDVKLRTTRFEAWWEWGTEWLQEQILTHSQLRRGKLEKGNIRWLSRNTWPKMDDALRRKRQQRAVKDLVDKGLIALKGTTYGSVTEPFERGKKGVCK